MLYDFAYTLISLFLMILVFFGLDAIFLAMVKKNIKWIYIIVSGTFYFIILFAALFFLLKSTTGHNMITYISGELDNSLKTALDNYKKGGASAQELEYIKEIMEIFFVKTFAGWCFVSVLFMVFLNYFVVRLFAIKKYNIKNEIRAFPEWYLDERVMWILLVALAFVIGKSFFKSEASYTAGLNFVIVMANLYFIIGISVLTFYLNKFGVPFYFQAAIYALFVIWPTISIVMVLTGIFDTWFNFRRLEKGGTIWK